MINKISFHVKKWVVLGIKPNVLTNEEESHREKESRSQVVDIETLAIEGWRLEQCEDEKGAGRASWADIERTGLT